MGPTTVTLTYKDLGGFELSQVISKISTTPTSAIKAAHIRRIVKEVQTARDQMSAEYKVEIMAKYFKHDDQGKLVTGEDGQFVALEGKEKEITEANEAFGEREVVLPMENIRPLTPSVLSDMKLSAKDIEQLKGLFSEQDGPGIPA